MHPLFVRPLTFAVLLLPLLAGAAAPAGTKLEDALAAFRAGDYARVVALAGEVGAGTPDEPRALFLAGTARLELGEAEPAARAFEALLLARPDSVPGLVGLARAHVASGRPDEAEKLLRRAVAADARDVDARRELGELLLRADRIPDARKELAAANELDAKDPFVARAWVDVLLRGDELARARKVADAFARARPKHAVGPFLQALCLERDGKDGPAIEAYEKAIELDEQFLDAHKNLAILCHTRNPTYQDVERTAKALAHYERYFALGGKDKELQRLYLTVKGVLDKLPK